MCLMRSSCTLPANSLLIIYAEKLQLQVLVDKTVHRGYVQNVCQVVAIVVAFTRT
jgi:hypothetical protein